MSGKHFTLEQLHALAVKARNHSHSPYSEHKVGSVIMLSSGEVFSGCNIENASYGGTVCAERVAIWKSVSEKGPRVHIKEVVVVVDAPKAWPPCGMCRQVIAEFATTETKVHTGNLQGIQKSFDFSEIFPESFQPNFLDK